MRGQEYRPGLPWKCPECSCTFQVSKKYQNFVAWGSMGLTFLILYLLGVRGVRLLVGTILLWFPVLLTCVAGSIAYFLLGSNLWGATIPRQTTVNG